MAYKIVAKDINQMVPMTIEFNIKVGTSAYQVIGTVWLMVTLATSA